ncbi:5-oxoprolinase subunit PxpB [Marinirhabdus gelatinilytica]|uniref:Inhibitor of KinA n=1 Tax=Marinirhabdus gelatinilytica TaxID=1703343 RepID=A0A370QFX5_9FLAO|nr:5-oxoprolinase subunit PxpB [Marinirhabdus gelatinilytica]RDK87265.1 inhibitor of KinA [Marinirhabdus gelatinilytica]
MKLPSIFQLSEKTVLLRWEPSGVSEIEERIQIIATALIERFATETIEVTPTYNELAIYLRTETNTANFIKNLEDFLHRFKIAETSFSARIVTVPVCYGEQFAPDIATVAKYHNIPKEKVIQWHTAPLYGVSFIGFLPGFPYLRGLPEKLHTPRLATPREKVARGSVGIGGSQTGVYPTGSPGGWNIIGRSPLEFFSVEKQPPSLLRAGDKLKFQSISTREFELISIAVASGTYPLKTETI